MAASLSTPASARSITSVNPATGETIATYPVMDEQAVREAVKRARAAQISWNKIGFGARAQIILKARDIILRDTDELAKLITKENGKPIVEAIGNDLMPVMDLMTYFASKSEKILKNEKIKLGKWGVLGHKSRLEFYPYGVVGVIAPWNFPFSIPMGGVVMALVVGNTVVLKPSEYTTTIGMRIKKIFDEAGLPPGVLEIVTGDGMTGAALTKSGVDKVTFTGSVNTGKKIMAACAENLTPLMLELGGKDPFIVFEDADIDTASSAAVWGAFCNSGQVCASVERVYVQEKIADKFTQLVVEKTKKIRQGEGTDANIDMGAMTAPMQLRKVIEHVNDAKKRGAQILTGGDVVSGGKGNFFQPTVMTGVDHSFPVVKEETFGPVLPIMTFKSEDEVVKLANDSEYALNAYVWGGDKARLNKVASQIVAGTVNINESLFTYALPQTPWGGPKLSGIGRTHGAHGLLDLVVIRHVHENARPAKKSFFWWYGYGPEKIVMMKLLNQALFGRGLSRVTSFFKFVLMSLKAKVN